MYWLRAIFNACYSIMLYKIDLFGYSVSMWNVVCYSLIGSILLVIFVRVTR